MSVYMVYCHHCEWPKSALPRPEAKLIGSPEYGALWHCKKHVDCKTCPHGAWTDGV